MTVHGEHPSPSNVADFAVLARGAMSNMHRYAVVYAHDGRITRVKNLGWLLRHWTGVKALIFLRSSGTPWDGVLVAWMRNHDIYLSTFASESVMRDWIHRPVFRGVSFTVASLHGGIIHSQGVA